MVTCPKCGKSFPNDTLVTVFIDKGDTFTKQRLCEPCAQEAVRGMYGIEIKAPLKKKWWKLWK